MKKCYIAAGLLTAAVIGGCLFLNTQMDRAVTSGSVDIVDIDGDRSALSGITVQGFTGTDERAVWIGEIQPADGTSLIDFCYDNDERIAGLTAYNAYAGEVEDGGALEFSIFNDGACISGSDLLEDMDNFGDRYCGYPISMLKDASSRVSPGTTETVEIPLPDSGDTLYPPLYMYWNEKSGTTEERYYYRSSEDVPHNELVPLEELFPLRFAEGSAIPFTMTRDDTGHLTEIRFDAPPIPYELVNKTLGHKIYLTVIPRDTEENSTASMVLDSPLLGSLWELDPQVFLDLSEEQDDYTGGYYHGPSPEEVQQRAADAVRPLSHLPENFVITELGVSPAGNGLYLLGFRDDHPVLISYDPLKEEVIQTLELAVPEDSTADTTQLSAGTHEKIQTAVIGNVMTILTPEKDGTRSLWGTVKLPCETTLINDEELSPSRWNFPSDCLFDGERLILLDQNFGLYETVEEAMGTVPTGANLCEVLVLSSSEVLYHGVLVFDLPGSWNSFSGFRYPPFHLSNF